MKDFLSVILSLWVTVIGIMGIFAIGLMPLWLVFALIYWVRS